MILDKLVRKWERHYIFVFILLDASPTTFGDDTNLTIFSGDISLTTFGDDTSLTTFGSDVSPTIFGGDMDNGNVEYLFIYSMVDL